MEKATEPCEPKDLWFNFSKPCRGPFSFPAARLTPMVGRTKMTGLPRYFRGSSFCEGKRNPSILVLEFPRPGADSATCGLHFPIEATVILAEESWQLQLASQTAEGVSSCLPVAFQSTRLWRKRGVSHSPWITGAPELPAPPARGDVPRAARSYFRTGRADE